MGDRMDVVGGIAVGTFGAAMDFGIVSTLAILLLTHALHAFVVAWFGWDTD